MYRLHISPLPSTDQLPPADLERFFQRFGKPVPGSFERPANDGLGQERNFGYLTVDFAAPDNKQGASAEKALQRCISMTSNSVWRGVKLRVAVAKPTFTERQVNFIRVAIRKG